MVRKAKAFSLGVPFLKALGSAELKAKLPPSLKNAALVGIRRPEIALFLDDIPNLLIGHSRFNFDVTIVGRKLYQFVHVC